MKIALVHDDFMQWGGAERVFFAIMQMYPEAPVYSLAFNKEVLPVDFPLSRIQTTFFQKGIARKLFEPLFFLHPSAFERFNFNDFDVVISSSSRFAKSIVTQPQTKHIAFINTPPRFLWPVSEGFGPKFYTERFIQKTFVLFRPLIRLMLPLFNLMLRMHDFSAAQRVDLLLGNSESVVKRINKFYRRDAEVLYPFVDLSRFLNVPLTNDNDEYLLIISRLASHKRIDLAIQACNRLNIPLKIIGSGPEVSRLQDMAGESVELLGYLSDNEVVEYLKNCNAFLYPQEEDFGITALEAQALGTPVIAYNRGGATETIEADKTGIFFDEQTVDSLTEAIQRFRNMNFDAQYIRKHAMKFSRERFESELNQHVMNCYNAKSNEM